METMLKMILISIMEELNEDIANESSESESDDNEELVDEFASAMDGFKAHVMSSFKDGLKRV